METAKLPQMIGWRLNEGLTPKFNFGGSLDLIWKNFSPISFIPGATGSSLRIQTESVILETFLNILTITGGL